MRRGTRARRPYNGARNAIILLGLALSACRSAVQAAPKAQSATAHAAQLARADGSNDTVIFSKDPKIPGRWLLSSSQTGELIAVTEGAPDANGLYRVRVLNRPSTKAP